MALIEAALGDPDDLAADAGRPSGDLLGEVRAVAADMRARGLTVHLEVGDGGGARRPGPGRHGDLERRARGAVERGRARGDRGGLGQVRLMALERRDAEAPCRLEVIVRDQGTGFDLARVDQARLGLRRSIAERIADCGGQASVWSAPGQGTVVRLSWPASGRPRRPGHRRARAWPDRRARRGEPAVVSHHEVARDTAETGLMRLVGAIAVIMPLARADPGAGQLA